MRSPSVFHLSFNIQIGMFLPEQFVSEEKYDFNGFYKNFLLQMFCDAEKIIIYLIPFVLNIQLKI